MSSAATSKRNGGFDPNTILATIGQGRKSLTVAKKHRIFTEGKVAEAVLYIKKG